MPNTEQMAQYVAANSAAYAAEDRAKGKDWMVPPPPKPGEYIICQMCGKPMLPEDFSKDPKIRKHEFKWHVHWDCEQNVFNQLDRGTPGLIAERESGTNLNAYKSAVSKRLKQQNTNQ